MKRPDILNLLFIEIVEFDAKHVPDLFRVISPELFSMGETFRHRIATLRDLPAPILVRSFAAMFFSYFISEIFMSKLHGMTYEKTDLQYMVDIYLLGILADDDPLRNVKQQ